MEDKAPQQSLGVLEEDDEFEEFAAAGTLFSPSLLPFIHPSLSFPLPSLP